MFARTVRAKTKDGMTEYVQLCQNYRDPKTGRCKTKVLHSLGRANELDMDAVRRLINSLSRLLPEEEGVRIRAQNGDVEFEYLGSKKLGGTALLDGLWRRLEVGKALERLLVERQHRTPVERLLFAMVANRALAPTSKLGLEHWVAKEVFIDGLPQVEVHQLYRAMDFLLEASEDIQREVFFSTANLLNLEVDLLFFDTTTTYFEVETEDDEDSEDLRKRGHSKDSRSDLPQVVIGFAVTREGIPVRCWVWPGNASDLNLMEEVKKDLCGWRLGRVVLVEDTGFNSEDNRRILQRAGGHYIIGEKMRLGGNGAPAEALKRGGKYRKLKDSLWIKEVVVGGDSEARRRFVIAFNPEEAQRDKQRRDDIVAETVRRLDELKQLDGEPHRKAACELRSHPAYGRYIRQTKSGKLRLNKAKIRAEEKFDGKYLISSSDDGLSAEDIALGYRQLQAIERVYRDLKHTLDIRPVYHRLEDRIRSHVLLCWLAMLLIRVIENETGETWFQIKKTLSTLTLGIHRSPSGQLSQSSPATPEQKELFKRTRVKLPPRYYELPSVKATG